VVISINDYTITIDLCTNFRGGSQYPAGWKFLQGGSARWTSRIALRQTQMEIVKWPILWK
jgi:hypothetical protein